MSFFEKFTLIFTDAKYLESMLTGLKTTLAISLGAAALGLVLGTIVALAGLSGSKNPLMKLLKAINEVLAELGEDGINDLVMKHMGLE